MIDTSIWEKETYYKQQDIVIVGAGLMGLWIALILKQQMPKISFTILEKNTTPLGASTRNAGFACFGSPTELLSDATTMGEDAMWQLVEMRFKGIEKIKQLFSASIIDFKECGGFECLLKKDELVLHKIGWLNKGMQTITKHNECFNVTNNLLHSNQLTGFDYLIQNKLEGTLHSGKLVNALTKKVQELGVKILFGAAVTNWLTVNDTIEINFNNTSIISNQLIFCTNAFTNTLVNEQIITPARGQVIVTTSIPNLQLNGSFHFDEGFYYWRNVGNRILLGGARNTDFTGEETTDLHTTAIIQQALELFLQQHIATKYQYSIEHKWSGIMAFTKTKTPICKKVSNNVYCAIACNGMGVALTPVFAEEVVNEIFNIK